LGRPTLGAGTVSYTGSGIDSQRLRVQAAPDLAAWSDIATNTIQDGRFGGVESMATTVSRRFYRAMVTSPITGDGQ
jgi:hypothetical protein